MDSVVSTSECLRTCTTRFMSILLMGTFFKIQTLSSQLFKSTSVKKNIMLFVNVILDKMKIQVDVVKGYYNI